MGFKEWLTANGYDETKLTDSQRSHLEFAWKAETAPPTPPTQQKDQPTPYEAELAAARTESARREKIQELAAEAIRNSLGNSQKIDRFNLICKAGIEGGWDTQRVQLEILKEDRNNGPLIISPSQPQMNDSVLEAAICSNYKLPNIEKKFSEQTLDSAHKQFRHGLGLKRLLLMGARQNGYRGDDGDWYRLCQFAVRDRMDEGQMMSAVGPSSGIQVPGILSNTANKFLEASFNFTEQAWRGIAKVRPVNDFKQITTYRMAGNNTFLRVAPSGEIKHGNLSETSYTNQAKTFGRMLGVSREDIINDDLGAFVSVAQELGRGAGNALNNIFWATWLDDAAFFPTDKSLLNYDDGSTDSVLSLAGLDNAEATFSNQTKPDGTPLGAAPKILLVPTALNNTALTLMSSMITNMATSSVALTGNANVFAGRYRVVSSAYLSKTSLPDENGIAQTVTGSSTAWYLLADPMDIPAIEVVFLFGKESPTVETDQFEFDRLGLATRAYFDFGVRKQEYRAGVKLKGAA